MVIPDSHFGPSAVSHLVHCMYILEFEIKIFGNEAAHKLGNGERFREECFLLPGVRFGSGFQQRWR
jgi:hypothetical protein